MMKLNCVTNSLTDHGLLVLELLLQLKILFSALALLQFIREELQETLASIYQNKRYVYRGTFFPQAKTISISMDIYTESLKSATMLMNNFLKIEMSV